MKKLFTTILCSLFTVTVAIHISTLNAYVKKSYSYRAKSYTPKAPYAGMGKRSSVNGMPKARITRGYFKPSNGYKFVNPYARSR